MVDGPIVDRSGLFLGFLRLLPEPVRRAYRTLVPERVRKKVRDLYPYEQDWVRSARFWTNRQERERQRQELRDCKTPGDYFDFATKYLGHQQWKDEILGFLDFVAKSEPVRICELGIFLGGTNLMLTHALSSVKTIIDVDLHLKNKSQLRYFSKPSQTQFFIEGKTCDHSTLEKVERVLHGQKLDLLFIDADHSYAGVKDDFLHYRQFVKDGGIIAFHDIVPDHLTKYNHDPQTWEGARSGEVYLFWNRLKTHYREVREFVVDYDQDGCGIGAIVYSSQVDIPKDL
jgi:predicted O-methyltransferase YrrM